MKLIICLIIALLVAVGAFKDLPERARGGEFYKKLQEQQKNANLKSKVGVAQTWSAPIDHFDSANNATFAQRYYVNSQYWDGTGPVFFEIGGEGTVTGPPGGFIETLGQNRSALLVALEHRFYGESIPNGNALTENYRYLTVEQALADLSSFTDFYKQTVPGSATVPWFVFGGSYPGGLASWYRTAYPSQSVGSLSSSGVVNCIVDYYQFDMQVSAAAGNACADDIRRIQTAFTNSFKSSSDNFNSALKQFNCEADMSIRDFYYMIADSWSMAVQYSAKSQLCSAINLPATATDVEVMQTFADFSNRFWGANFCAGGFYNTKQLADPARWEINSRSWRYQTCAQVSYFNTAPVSGSLRDTSVNLEYHLQQCAEVFGQKMFPASEEMNEKYGGAFPKATNVFYSDFSDDPWQRASVSYPVSSSQPYHLAQCDDCGHCLDFHTPSSSDPVELQEGRVEFEGYLDAWLAEWKAAQKK